MHNWEARQNGIPGDTSTLTYMDSGTWTEALWSGRPRHESPKVGMQMGQPQTTERHKSRDTHATAFQDPVSADGKQGEILVTNVQLTCVPKCKLPENLLKINPTTSPSVNRTCTHTMVSHCISVLFCTARCLMVSVPYAQSTLQRIWKTMCKSPCGSAQGGSPHSCRQQLGFFLSKRSTLSVVN